MPLLLIVGAGPGNSRAIARHFGGEGYSIALIGRDAEHLRTEVEHLHSHGVAAHSYVGDAGDPASIRAVVLAAQAEQGQISAVVFTAYRNDGVSDVLNAEPEAVAASFDVGVVGLLAAVQAAVADLRSAKGASILVLNGAAGDDDSGADRFATSFGVDGVALESAAKSKLVGLLAERLRPDGIYVGEIVINGTIKGSAFASPTAIDPSEVANRLWTMAETRTETRTRISEAASGEA